MSRPEEPHRPFFPFGNPFRKISPECYRLPSKLGTLLNNFEDNLAQRLKKLNPKVPDDVLSISWMILAMEVLCDTYKDIKFLISLLELPLSDWEEKWIDVYFDVSVKLLDICNAFSAEISRLNQGNLILRCGLHKLEPSSSKQFVQALSSLDGWRTHISSKGQRSERCSTILDSLVQSLDLPKVKNSVKGKVFMHAMYGVQMVTVFICSVFSAAFSGCEEMLVTRNVSNTYRWAQAFTELQTNVNGEVRNIFSSGRFTALKDLEAVDLGVKNLYSLIQVAPETIEVDELQISVKDLGRKTECFSQGLDLLTKKVDGFFYVVLSGRDDMLSGLRVDGSETKADPWPVKVCVKQL